MQPASNIAKQLQDRPLRQDPKKAATNGSDPSPSSGSSHQAATRLEFVHAEVAEDDFFEDRFSEQAVESVADFPPQ